MVRTLTKDQRALIRIPVHGGTAKLIGTREPEGVRLPNGILVRL